MLIAVLINGPRNWLEGCLEMWSVSSSQRAVKKVFSGFRTVIDKSYPHFHLRTPRGDRPGKVCHFRRHTIETLRSCVSTLVGSSLWQSVAEARWWTTTEDGWRPFRCETKRRFAPVRWCVLLSTPASVLLALGFVGLASETPTWNSFSSFWNLAIRKEDWGAKRNERSKAGSQNLLQNKRWTCDWEGKRIVEHCYAWGHLFWNGGTWSTFLNVRKDNLKWVFFLRVCVRSIRSLERAEILPAKYFSYFHWRNNVMLLINYNWGHSQNFGKNSVMFARFSLIVVKYFFIFS